MNGLALFAGIGGLELGVRLAVPGYRTVCYVERDAFAEATLVARMEDKALGEAPIWDDICTFDGGPWRGQVDIVTGGFPCTDISVSGKGAGIEGKHSGLWSEYARLVREVRPRFVFVENTPALTSRGLSRVLGDLAELGFDAEWDCFSAAGVGAPHLRRRIFILARRIPDPVGDTVRDESERGAGSALEADIGNSEPGHMGEDMADTLCSRRAKTRCGPRQQAGSESLERSAPMAAANSGGLLWPPGPNDTEGWQSYIARNGPEPAIRRGADGSAYRMDRLRCLGNAVVPSVAARAYITLSERSGE